MAILLSSERVYVLSWYPSQRNQRFRCVGRSWLAHNKTNGQWRRCFHSFIFILAFPLGRVAVATGGIEIPQWFQKLLIAHLAPNQDGTKQGRRCNHAIWSLVEIYATFPWVQPAGFTSPIFPGASRCRAIVAAWDLFIWRSDWTFKVFEVHSCALRTLWWSVTSWTFRKNPISAACVWDSTLSVITRISYDGRWGSEQKPI